MYLAVSYPTAHLKKCNKFHFEILPISVKTVENFVEPATVALSLSGQATTQMSFRFRFPYCKLN